MLCRSIRGVLNVFDASAGNRADTEWDSVRSRMRIVRRVGFETDSYSRSRSLEFADAAHKYDGPSSAKARRRRRAHHEHRLELRQLRRQPLPQPPLFPFRSQSPNLNVGGDHGCSSAASAAVYRLLLRLAPPSFSFAATGIARRARTLPGNRAASTGLWCWSRPSVSPYLRGICHPISLFHCFHVTSEMAPAVR